MSSMRADVSSVLFTGFTLDDQNKVWNIIVGAQNYFFHKQMLDFKLVANNWDFILFGTCSVDNKNNSCQYLKIGVFHVKLQILRFFLKTQGIWQYWVHIPPGQLN